MEEKVKNRLLKIINDTIDDVVYDEIKQVPEKLKIIKQNANMAKSQRAEQAHDALFGFIGDDNRDFTNKLRLNESIVPKINISDIEKIESDFKKYMPSITFERIIGVGKSGEIIDFPIKNGKTDAFAMGKLDINGDNIGFTMSILDGLKIKSLTNDGFELKKDNKDTFFKLLNLYEKIFKENIILLLSYNTEQPIDNVDMD